MASRGTAILVNAALVGTIAVPDRLIVVSPARSGVELSEEWTIPLNNDTSGRVYLNVEMLDDLISLPINRIDEILTIVRPTTAGLESLGWKLSETAQARQIQLEYLGATVIRCQATEEAIRAAQQAAQESTRQTRGHINGQASSSGI